MLAYMTEETYAELGRRRAELKQRLDDVEALLRIRAPEEAARRGEGHDSELAREAGVSRMTMLEWLGKRQPRRKS
jgi:hypothetical protein